MPPRPIAHLFCKVVDNFGDAGIAWVLATGLAESYGFDVTLCIDDPAPLEKIAPDYAQHQQIQIVTAPLPSGEEVVTPAQAGVQVIKETGCQLPLALQNISSSPSPPNLVIEVLAGTVPDEYTEWAASLPRPPIWLIYEYLSAETWVEDAHLKPSPHPRLTLTRYFFYPGFTPRTGGLLFDAHNRHPGKAEGFIRDLTPTQTLLKISLFCYDHAPIGSLIDVLSQSTTPIALTIPDGLATPIIRNHLGLPADHRVFTHQNLTVHLVPFVPRPEFNAFLDANDLNLIRGEESLTAAIMGGKPLIWHIYPQDDAAHHIKLTAFLRHYTRDLSPQAAKAVIHLHQIWNSLEPGDLAAAWQGYLNHLPEITAQAREFAQKMRQNGSALKNLVDFYQKHC